MSFNFIDKTILIISPCTWSDFQVSKHHYAVELAKTCRTVYFLSPPCFTNQNRIGIDKIRDHDNLYEIKMEVAIPQLFRFHFYKIYQMYIKSVMRKLCKKINAIDVVWSFEHIKYPGIEVFNAKINIYHPVDQFTEDRALEFARKNDIVFSCSYDILEKLKNCGVPFYFINHGLSNFFLNVQNVNPSNNSKIKIGFAGNVDIPQIDFKTFEVLVDEHPELVFYFYGKTEYEWTTPSYIKDFIDKIRSKSNCKLAGVLHPSELAIEINKMDVLLLCYDMNKMNKGNNSHKIMEYFSTGKVIVSNHFAMYHNLGLIEMMNDKNNELLPELFNKVINNIKYYNSAELRKKRIEFALDNTYVKQIERIEQIIQKL